MANYEHTLLALRLGCPGADCPDEREAIAIDVESLRAEVAALRKWNADMVAKVAEGSLDGYRELRAKCAALEAERDALRRVVAAADAMLENMHE